MKLTRNDLAKKLARIEHYKSQLNELRREGFDPEDNENIGFNYNSGQALMMEQEGLLLSLIKNEQAEIDVAEIIDELEIPEDVVGLGDTVTLLFQRLGEEPSEATLLVSDEAFGQLGVAVSTRSPIGMAIYGKSVGETVNCQTPNGKLTITILEKTKARVMN